MRTPGLWIAVPLLGALTSLIAAGACSVDPHGTGAGGAGGAAGAGGAVGGAGGAAGEGGAGGAAGAGGAGGAGGTGGHMVVCGDGTLEGAEQCDDGNAIDGDGCSSGCIVDLSDDCPGTAVALSPPGIELVNDLTGLTDDHMASCGSSGAPDVVYAVTPTASGTLTATLARGNGAVSIGLRCPSDFSSAVTEITCATAGVPRQMWVHAGVTYHVLVDGDGAFTLDLKLSACGDGVVEGLEGCDAPGDPTCIGCVTCDGPGQFWDPATRHCYWLEQTTQRTFADARAACVAWGGDLAAPSTLTEYYFIAFHQNPAITQDTWIGAYADLAECSYAFVNGERWRSEWADDNEPSSLDERCVQIYTAKGNKMNDRDCNNNHHFVCERAPAGGCGDLTLQPGEACDDGNVANGDGCDAQCQREVVCGAGEFSDPATGHCYRMVTGAATTWYQAKLACEAMGGYLASVDAAAEMTLLRDNTPGNTWFGAREGGFSDGTVAWEAPVPACLTNWAGGQPNSGNDDCVELFDDGTWNDRPCNEANDYVCERAP